MKEQPVTPKLGFIPKLEKIVGSVFAKLKIFWKQETAHTGIQFYVEMDD